MKVYGPQGSGVHDALTQGIGGGACQRVDTGLRVIWNSLTLVQMSQRRPVFSSENRTAVRSQG